MRRGCKTVSAALLMLLPMMPAVHAETVKDATETASKPKLERLKGFWVEKSGHGVLAIDGDLATLSPKGDLNLDNLYNVELNGDELTLTPADGSKKFNKPMTTTVDWEGETFSLKRGRYQFVPAPNIKASELDGYWYEETKIRDTLEVRAMEYKNNASSYDFHWWEVNPAYGSYQKGLDEDVPMQITNGFVFSNPKAGDDYLHYAIKREGDTIYYVDTNGAQWSETKTETLKKYQPPKGYKELKDWMTGEQ
jgi:hypothetical protein